MDIESYKISKPEDVNIILGQAHFIKTVEDIYEAIVSAVPQAKFAVAFCESSGPCLVRSEGNDPVLKKLAEENMRAMGAGHSFLVIMKDCYPINVMKAVKDVQEVCAIYCATANPVEVLLAQGTKGRGIIGVIDGESPKGIEQDHDRKARKDFLRKIGYKL
jgi:hypothetical protein